MAKRKRLTAATTSRKRAKGGSHAHGDFDPEREYKVKSIVGERTNRGRKEYLISWEDDEETGESFIDTWEPRENANQEAIDDWKWQKSEKRRIARQSGQDIRGSTSNSGGSTPGPATPKQPTPPRQVRGRPRKLRTVESSPAVDDRQQTNGHQPQQEAEGVLEIDESQHSESGDPAEEPADSTAASPLFVPHYNPIERSSRVLAHVKPTPPHASYLAGAYEALSSSQLPPSSEAPVGTQPEPSQYIPDPAETSGATDDTTEVSAALTTPSQHARPVPVNFGDTPAGLEADSQSAPGSSSYVPSVEGPTSHSDSPAQESIVTSSASAPQPVEERVESQADEVSGRSQDPDTEPQHPSADHVESTDSQSDQNLHAPSQPSTQPGDTSQPPSNFTAPPKPTGSQQITEISHSNHIEQENNIDLSQSADKHQKSNSSPTASHLPADQHVGSQAVRESAWESPSRRKSPPTTSGTAIEQDTNELLTLEEVDRQSLAPGLTLDSTSAPAQTEAAANQSTSEIETGQDKQQVPERLDSSTLSEIPNPRSPSSNIRARLNDSHATPTTTSQDPHRQDDRTSEAPGPVASLVDLTSITQEPPTSLPPFSVTPPRREAIPTNHSYPHPPPPDSRDWQSSFPPFATQVPPVVSVNTAVTSSEVPNQPLPQIASLINARSTHPEIGSSVAASHSQPVLDSSPLPRAPSQSIGTADFGDSAPARPTIPSTPHREPSATRNMDNTQTTPASGGSLADKFKAMRDRQKRERAMNREEIPTSTPAKVDTASTQNNEQQSLPGTPTASLPAATVPPTVSVAASEALTAIPPPKLASPLLFAQDGWRSPSAVPHMEQLPPITQAEMNIAGRYETLLPQSQEYGAHDQRNGSLTSAGTPSKERNGYNSEETALHTIPLSMVGSQRDHYPSTVYFYRDSIQSFLDDSNPGPEMVNDMMDFVERMRRITMHLDLDNSETLTQYDVAPEHQADWDVKSSAKFRFLKDLFYCVRDQDLTIAIVARPGRVVDMLDTFLEGKQIPYRRLGTDPPKTFEGQGNAKALLLDTYTEIPESGHADLVIAMENVVRHDTPQIRALRRKGGRWVPFVSMIVPRTVEHIERCLSPALSDRAASRALVSGIFQFRNDAGRLEEGQEPPIKTAVALAQYLARADSDAVWPIAPLTLLQDLGSQTESDIQPEESTSGARTGEKRSREPDDILNNAADANKRLRVEPQSSAVEGEVTHISDSIDKSTQSNDASTGVGKSSQQKTDEKRIRLLHDALDQVDEHKRDLANLQFRFEEQRTTLLEVQTERDAAIQTAQNAVTRINEQSNNMSTLRNRQSKLEEEVKDAKERLFDHSVPERAEFEALRLTTAQAKADKEKSDRLLVQAQKDLAYVRELYQNSSSSAQELATQNTDLENQVAVLRNRATGEQAKLRQMNLDDRTKNLRSENKKLKMMLNDRETAIKFRDEEIAKLKEASRGRMGTRGSSVPRTPRVGSPMKPDRRLGSRQTSPAAGELRERERPGMLHPLRNAQGLQ